MFETTQTLPAFFVPVLIYVAAINLVAFVIYALDKVKATSRARRISEKTLWTLALLGGTAGAMLSMHLFRHKTKKHSFQAVLLLILLGQLALIFLIFDEMLP